MIDIGANVGYYSLLASRQVGASGRVYAFEASPSIFTELARNLAINNATNVVARNVAVTRTCAKVPIFLNNRGNLGESTIIPAQANRQSARLETMIDGYPLTQLVETDVICSARFIKIDVEGAEWLVLQGMKGALSDLSEETEILVEIADEPTRGLGSSPAEVLAIFAEAGFAAFEIENDYRAPFYIKPPDRVQLVPYDGRPFTQKDFVLRKVSRDTAYVLGQLR